MEIRRGDVFYNQKIPKNEVWEDTLKRELLQIMQIESIIPGLEPVVNIFESHNGSLCLLTKQNFSNKGVESLINLFTNRK